MVTPLFSRPQFLLNSPSVKTSPPIIAFQQTGAANAAPMSLASWNNCCCQHYFFKSPNGYPLLRCIYFVYKVLLHRYANKNSLSLKTYSSALFLLIKWLKWPSVSHYLICRPQIGMPSWSGNAWCRVKLYSFVPQVNTNTNKAFLVKIYYYYDQKWHLSISAIFFDDSKHTSRFMLVIEASYAHLFYSQYQKLR